MLLDGKVLEYMTTNVDPEVLPDALDIDPIVMNMVERTDDQDMYDDDMIEYDFGDSPPAVGQQLNADNCSMDDDDMTDDDDFATDDNYSDHSDNEDDDDQGNGLRQEAIAIEAMGNDEEGGLYVDPWDKEPPLRSDVPFEETVQGSSPLDKHHQKSFELYSWIQEHNVSRDAYTSLLSMLNGWIVDDSFGKGCLFKV